ncbi:Gfo/Idh/MocA family protein [Streptomyces sp. NPDC127098]|uniref:Gfo/Idh/MocA family protein n=1 Tax=Streptomyces sp. NPDC127098 TaxID=3347137 RepID=UPI0036641805
MQALGVALIGHAFMGRVHSHAWRSVGAFFGPSLEPRMTIVAGTDRARTEEAAARLGWQHATDNWQQAVHRDDVGIVDICSPGDSHAEIAIAALEAGKHVLCEKPLANTVAEAEAMVAAARRARERGVRSMVGFTYRRTPALSLARRMVAEGRIGRVYQVRAAYLQDWLHDPDAPFTWRLDRARAGSGALGDIGSHITDLAEHLVGDRLDGVSGQTATFVESRPLPGAPEGTRGEVTVDDAAVFTGRFTGGALGVFEATRFAAGRKNALRIELNGTAGSLAFDFESMNELWFHDATEPAAGAGFRRIVVTEPEHPYVAAWWPPGHGLGYEHAFTHQARDFLEAVAAGTDPEPGFEDGLHVQRVLAAVEESAANESRYTRIEPDTSSSQPVRS